jgi:hypothetical protein
VFETKCGLPAHAGTAKATTANAKPISSKSRRIRTLFLEQ